MAKPAENTAAYAGPLWRSRVLDIDRCVSARIRERRIMLGLTTEQMGELIAVTRSQVHRYETGITRIAAGRLYWIARALGVDVGYFYQDLDVDVPSYREVNPQAHTPTGPVKFVAKLEEIWRLDASELSRLLGLEDQEGIDALASGVRSLDTRDLKDRVRHLMRIREALHSLFQNLDAEREWLREPKPELQGQSPIDTMLEGFYGESLDGEPVRAMDGRPLRHAGEAGTIRSRQSCLSLCESGRFQRHASTNGPRPRGHRRGSPVPG